jgi:membrane associated rhomboid family serine protease
MAYLTSEENYVFVGNEKEVWLENLDHPKVQLIYINDQERLTEAHASYITRKVTFISNNIKRQFLMCRINTLILNVESFDDHITSSLRNISFVNVENAEAVYENQLLSKLFPSIKKTNLNANVIDIATKLQNDTKIRANKDVQLLNSKGSSIVILVYLVLLTAIGVYLMVRASTLPHYFVAIHYGATYSPLIVAGAYWRLLVATFMHMDPLHLTFNAMFIYRFGSMLEGIIGKWRMIFVIMVSALMGSLFGFAFSPHFSVGASGAAYGFMGVLLFLGFEMRKMFMPMIRRLVIPMIVASVLFSLFIPNIDHFGHLGGFIGGFLAAAIVGIPSVKPFFFRSVLTIATLLILVSGLWNRGVRLTEVQDFDTINRALIFQYVEMGELERAEYLIRILVDEVE